MKDEILVINDCINSYCIDYFLQIVSKARSLADQLNCKVTVFCFGDGNIDEFEKLHLYGADKIIRCEVTDINAKMISNILEDYIKDITPRMIMFTDSEIGRASASFISIRFKSGLTADCINIFIDEDSKITFERAAMNSSLIANIKTKNSMFDLCTIKKNVFEKQLIERSNSLEVQVLDYKTCKIEKQFEIIEILEENIDKKKVDLNNAQIIIGIGRGIKNNYEKVEKLAQKLNAEIIGTRAVVEEGIIDESRQVGQSGQTISPDIYLALGISGASQHIVGVKNAKIIIAVNMDENAPIFNYADYVIVDDVEKILNEILKLVD
ncbi:MAG: electron transfer flavoprotein subunit alpha/FixB family protein [Clostridium sp.]|jgi:electron transfer flavoprotein alpha subunit|nr:electron transfer flavoprotein subunit alpha/FixB family protein [Clostridium sp.]